MSEGLKDAIVYFIPVRKEEIGSNLEGPLKYSHPAVQSWAHNSTS